MVFNCNNLPLQSNCSTFISVIIHSLLVYYYIYLIKLHSFHLGLYRQIYYTRNSKGRKFKEMEIPVIDFSYLGDERRSETMALLHEACQKWGFFMIENHGIDKELMERVKQLMNDHYKENMKDSFYNSDIVKSLENNECITEKDWETTFFIWHRPNSNINELTSLSKDLRKTMDEYIDQVIKLAEKLSELMCENLGIQKNHIKEAFSGSGGPSVGTKVAMYPQCPRPELIRGLREHTDAGGIILLLQDDQVPGLEFFKDGKWVHIPHRVMAMKDGKRLSVATFYNPAGDAIISPASELLLPNHFRFGDYLNLYSKTKFGDKGLRFQSLTVNSQTRSTR